MNSLGVVAKAVAFLYLAFLTRLNNAPGSSVSKQRRASMKITDLKKKARSSEPIVWEARGAISLWP